MAAISESDIGKRVTIRLKGDDGYHDLVGELLTTTSLLNRHGKILEFDPERIHIWRVIYEAPRSATSGAPLSIRIYELERTLNATWSAIKQEERNGWLFRADQGITKRANSVLVLNSDINDEVVANKYIDELIGWYRELGLNPTVHLIPTLHKKLDGQLEKRGFTDSLDALVLVKDLLPSSIDTSQTDIDIDFEIEVTKRPSREWLATQGDQELSELMARGSAKYVAIKDSSRTIAVGRVAFSDDWAVLSRIWVATELRGKGLGRRILALLESEVDVSKIALQVASSNQVAINLYESAGYQLHHEYRFRALPQKIGLIQDLCC